MPEPNAPANPDAGKLTDEQVQISKAELEGLKAGKQFYDTVQERAKGILGDQYNAEDYLEEIESTAKKALDFEDELTKLKGNGATRLNVQLNQPNPPAPVIPAGLSEEDRKLIQQANTSATTALLDSQFTRFTLVQGKLPEAAQSANTKEQLLKVIGGPKRPLVGELLNDPQFEGNAFMVADYLLNEAKERAVRAKEGADRTKAIDKAKVAGNINVSTVGAPPDNEKKTENDKLADNIISDDAPVVFN